uniref:Vacuolar ATPase assembly factor VMA21 n=1 Tax=Astyanax mexicanus TaxID=7994 RepID=A0A8B9HFH4_ASTMX
MQFFTFAELICDCFRIGYILWYIKKIDSCVSNDIYVISSLSHSFSLNRNDGSLVSVLKTLLFFTILMITLPIGLYFATKAYLFEASLGYSSNDSYFYAAIVAVIAVHVVLALFVYAAWNEGSRQWREGKQD